MPKRFWIAEIQISDAMEAKIRQRRFVTGDEVREGEPLMTLHTDEPERFDRALEALEGGYDVAPSGSAYEPGPIVLDRIS